MQIKGNWHIESHKDVQLLELIHVMKTGTLSGVRSYKGKILDGKGSYKGKATRRVKKQELLENMRI